MSKRFRSLDEQIILLYSRGIKISDTLHTKNFLLRKNYYNTFNVYGKLFRKEPGIDKFIYGTSSDEIEAFYYFDRNVRMILLKILLEVETNVKSTISHFFCNTYRDQNSYLNFANFDQKTEFSFNFFKDFIYKDLVTKYHTKPQLVSNSINHYLSQNKPIPLWILTNFLSFGNIEVFFNILRFPDKSTIVKSFRELLIESYGVNLQLSPDEFSSFLLALKELRNRAAHDNCLINFKLTEATKYNYFIHSEVSLNPHDDRKSLYMAILSIKAFVSKSNFDEMMKRIHVEGLLLQDRISSIDLNIVLKGLGFPENWLSQ